MAERKARGGSRAARGAKRRSDVIDVEGEERPEDAESSEGENAERDGDSDDEDKEKEEKEESDDDLIAAASQVIDVGDDGSVQGSGDWPIPEEKEERDPDASDRAA